MNGPGTKRWSVSEREASSETISDVLLVEDNAGDVRLMREALKEGSCAVRLHVASDGEEAMAFLLRQSPFEASPKPSLILLDLNLPKKDGREVLADIKKDESLRRIPVIILTSSSLVDDIRKAYDLYANSYLIKPAALDKLVEMGKLIETFWLKTAIRHSCGFNDPHPQVSQKIS